MTKIEELKDKLEKRADFKKKITDYRFKIDHARVLNNYVSLTNRNGLIIRVSRPTELRFPNEYKTFLSSDFSNWDDYLRQCNKKLYKAIYHASETELDHSANLFHYQIINDSTLENLIEQVKKVLKKENII